MKTITMIIATFILLATNISAQWTITEVMYDPIGSDSENEWIELSGPIFPPEIKFYEDGGNHNIRLMQGNCQENCLIIIADNSDIFLESYFLSDTVLLYDSSWSSLKNTGEKIGLKNGTEILLSEEYPAISKEAESLHLKDNIWTAGQPTPGEFITLSAEVPEFTTLTAIITLSALGLLVNRIKKKYV